MVSISDLMGSHISFESSRFVIFQEGGREKGGEGGKEGKRGRGGEGFNDTKRIRCKCSGCLEDLMNGTQNIKHLIQISISHSYDLN